MTRAQRAVDVNDLLAGVAELVQQVQVLVTAVDDLRCEVEWRMRNTVHADPPQSGSRPEMISQEESVDDDEHVAMDSSIRPAPVQINPHEPSAAPSDISPRPRPSACSELEKLEQALMVGPRGAWPEEWEGVDPPELAIGHVVIVDEILWTSVLDLRPAHVVGFDCDCEADEGTPYMLAWRTAEKCFLRELNDSEARTLQAACLAAQAERAVDQENIMRSAHRQQALW